MDSDPFNIYNIFSKETENQVVLHVPCTVVVVEVHFRSLSKVSTTFPLPLIVQCTVSFLFSLFLDGPRNLLVWSPIDYLALD